ncbi:MAG: leucine-rich repeat domain-containing protein [Candidatus Moeniiplasma glomeromycotorum]|nr:leucine-rich repeat domain-containing protein [Candidatus Moeniiplasma glomeromycotorum]MCE8162330.1 leucine-rich repeat domain-containing protein [Candidatus Moeniiplasma glomeromycotorum]MCE8166254.1 leucine-rich repeat domain-containing protein [Candidatus Moeniiplasma glomeromycotorum]MCE8166736.1 leucine-rich repeat domain-containing protein [Candidatus Moeniiplasma glomeromycotorum]
MTRNVQEYIDRIINKGTQLSLNLKDQKLFGAMDLGKFTNLVSIQASGNEFTDLCWLFTLPESSQKKLKWLNLWGNKIESVDFARLLNVFPNLESINLENNPLSGSNFETLNDQKFSQLVELVETKKLKINSWKGTFLLNLLKYAK